VVYSVPTSCSHFHMAGMYTVSNITFSCPASVPAADCPLTGPSSAATITFTFESSNICANQVGAALQPDKYR
jgi:hypothetical protein